MPNSRGICQRTLVCKYHLYIARRRKDMVDTNINIYHRDGLMDSEKEGSMASKGPVVPSTVIWSTEQLHQLEMAKLEIEKLDRENRRIELEATNQRAKERHEDKMLRRKMLMKLVNEDDSNDEAWLIW